MMKKGMNVSKKTKDILVLKYQINKIIFRSCMNLCETLFSDKI